MSILAHKLRRTTQQQASGGEITLVDSFVNGDSRTASLTCNVGDLILIVGVDASTATVVLLVYKKQKVIQLDYCMAMQHQHQYL